MRCRIIFYLFIFLNVIVYEDYTHTHRVIVYEDHTHTHTCVKLNEMSKKGILKISNFSSYVISIITWEYLLLVMN